MLIVITFLLIIIFLSNFFLYWIVFLKTKREISKWWDHYTQLYFLIWIGIIFLIPILTSSYLSLLFHSDLYYKFPNISLEIIFFILGIVLIILSVKFGLSTMKLNKMKGLAKGKFHLITDGLYNIMRHPMNACWAIFFLGLALIFESLIALIITPFLMLILEVEGFLEEKYLLIPIFGEKYELYKKKTSSRLFPTPYNILLIIIAIFIIYVGVLGFF